ncbi:hypothetical protein Glove_529g5 [Diversispora epigaea]|uniref:Uncharacterized protein n=1 Tax=Diversispora epigaea TaxID=1348612 RepID=A0A397GF97_9GLOM|nr:hypothetical protein Glove_529g5 [Diversispora epigaea]
MSVQFEDFEKHLDPDDLSLISILYFRRNKDNFTYNKGCEHALISKFLTRLLQLPEWYKGALALKKDGVLQQTQNEEVTNFWLDIENNNAQLQIDQAQIRSVFTLVTRSKSNNKAHDLIEEQKLNAILKRTLDHGSENYKKIKRARRPVNNAEDSTYTDENPLQENEDEATTEKSSQENDEKKITPNDIITDILGDTVEYLDISKEIFLIYKKDNPDGNLIDFRLNSLFFKVLPKSTKIGYLEEMDKKIESLLSKKVHDFLVQFFSKKLTAKEWYNEIDNLRSPELDDDIMIALVRVIRRTLPQFIKAFALEDQNPLLNITTLEGAHLNSFVHPCFDAFLWHISNVHYEYREITSKRHVNRNRADGAGYMIDANKFQLIYVEGSRPVTKKDKEIDDLKKITNNLENMFAEIVKDTIKNRRHLPSTLYVFGDLSFCLRIQLFYIDYYGAYRLNEVDNTNIPRNFSEIPDFVYFYECVLKWALLIRDVTQSFENARSNNGRQDCHSQMLFLNWVIDFVDVK